MKKIIEAVNSRGVKINGRWIDFAEAYEGLSYREIEKGKKYELEFIKDDKGNWRVASVRLPDGEFEKREKRIARMNALTNAVNLCAQMGEADPKEVIKIAERFYSWIMQEGKDGSV